MKNHAPITDRPTSLLTRKLPILAASLLTLTLAALAVSSMVVGKSQASLPAPETARMVRTAPVLVDGGTESLRLPGVLRAGDQADLAFLHAGQVAELRVRPGQAVAAGELLALLYNPSLSPGLAASEARLQESATQLAQAEREYRRIVDLHSRGLVPTEELERLEARRDGYRQSVALAEAQRREASEQLNEATLRAPFAGTVVDTHAEAGEFIGAGQALLSLAGNGALEVELNLGPARAQQLEIGQQARVAALAAGDDYPARITEIGLGRPGQPARLRLRLDQAPAHCSSGLGVEVTLEHTGPTRLSVPLTAVIDAGAAQPHLYRVEGGRAIQVLLALGQVRGGQVTVDGALAAGDHVIVAGHGQLLDDEPVQVLP